MQRHRTIAALLLALLLTSAQAKDKGPALFVTITAPAAGQPLHDAATYQVDVEFLRDEVPLVLTIAIDPRLAVQGVTATAGISCEVTAPIVCTGVIDSARPATVWADLALRPNAIACPEVTVVAQAQADGETAVRTRHQAAAGCLYVPYVERP